MADEAAPTEPTTEEPTTPDVPATEPHGEESETDWKAEARKWEDRAKSNYEAAQRLAEIEEAQKSEEQKRAEALDAAERRAAEAERQLMVLEIAAEKGLTPAQAKRLSGSTREELEADAAELLDLLAPQHDPPPGGRPRRLHSGNGDDPESSFDPEALASRIASRNTF